MRLTLIAGIESVSICSLQSKKVRAIINALSERSDITVIERNGLSGYESEIEVTVNGKKKRDIPAT